MTVAPQSFVSTRRRRSRRAAVSSKLSPKKANSRQQLSSAPSGSRVQSVQKLPSSQISPLWLRSLLFVQRGSNFVSLCLIGVTLILYAWTVYSQQLWSREYSKLEALQRNERHLTATNEVIKNQLAKLAERPGTGLVNPNPANTLFLSPAPVRQFTAKPTATEESKSAPTTPLGY